MYYSPIIIRNHHNSYALRLQCPRTSSVIDLERAKESEIKAVFCETLLWGRKEFGIFCRVPAVCIHICIYTYIHVELHLRIHVCTYIRTAPIYLSIYLAVSLSICIYIHTCTYLQYQYQHEDACIYVYIYIHVWYVGRQIDRKTER